MKKETIACPGCLAPFSPDEAGYVAFVSPSCGQVTTARRDLGWTAYDRSLHPGDIPVCPFCAHGIGVKNDRGQRASQRLLERARSSGVR